MRAFADRLIEITERHAEKISDQWSKAVRTNLRTPSFHSKPHNECIQQGMDFYKKLRDIFFSEKPYTEVYRFFSKYAEDRYLEGTPLKETIYALIMMRRHMWLYADVQAMFLTPLDQHKAIESINKTIRIFDHGTYFVIQKYEEMSR
ncbi:MAG: histidine kinase N-terminal domain-containing protein [Desulfobacterales bacterium]|nr:histidine kinase N-terminal domain-containing protein [Desulfobacterales bacterium]MDD4072334.1 histidine kinase N-terminal domain-containing protein [Desulfobacterales bacterium]MDD4392398.1 histidine kinase N-terminal domain-containing protein [Desulfobacterales bacterium]